MTFLSCKYLIKCVVYRLKLCHNHANEGKLPLLKKYVVNVPSINDEENKELCSLCLCKHNLCCQRASCTFEIYI